MAKYIYESLLPQGGNTGQNFPYYRKKKTGQPVFWENEFKERVERGPFIRYQQQILDTENEYDAQLLEYLLDHPYRNQTFKLRDLERENRAREAMKKRRGAAARKIMMMRKEDAPKFMAYFNYTEFDDGARADLIEQMKDPDYLIKVEEALEVKNLPMIVTIREMVEYGIIYVQDGVYYAEFNNSMLGINEVSVAENFNKNMDVFKEMEKDLKRKIVNHKTREKNELKRLTLDPN